MRNLFLVSIVAATLVSGCRGDDGRPAHDRGQIEFTVYFLTDEGAAPLGVRRSVRRESPFARQALVALIEGPTKYDRDDGIDSAIPEDATVRTFSIAASLSRASGTATVDLGGMPSLDEAGAADIARVGTQVARTLIGLSGIERVRLRANGKPWGFWSMQPPHRVLDQPWDYDRLLGLTGICGAGRQGETDRRNCFSALP